ncbi:serine/threonine-protein kinase [Catenuloplanes indicus]|uniref:non-specific serine/threonine protein kinase n=1 Tax=Catenuloplanes indicus TaxID=137267 RepID=A0AAE4AWL1_9ACTN|nr:serine/threonine-protein kinase [Catenuloplanes indicus]MDQ0365164.1 serine/threonine-protein kinase [Catenuloplanes indicus]
MRRIADRYRLDAQVGRGGMAVVWRGHDLVLHRTVAVKVWSPASDPEPDSARRMRDEAAAAARLNHPRVARIFDYGEDDAWGQATPYLVLEFIEGETLFNRLRRGPMPWAQAARVCAHVAEGLAAAHAAGLVHRDIKPANIMLTADGAKIIDFGVASPAGQETLDPAGRVWGTLRYLAPEQIHGGPAAPSCDVFALAVTLGECLTGSRPRRERRRRTEPSTAAPVVRGLPASIAALHRRCVADDPRVRPTAADVAHELRTAVAARSDAAGRPRAAHPRRVAGVLAGSAAAMAAAIVAAPIGGHTSDEVQAAALDDAPSTPACAARYETRRGTDGTFAATLTLTNTGRTALRAWELTFAVPRGHRVTEVRSATAWSQHQRTVRVVPSDGLPAGAATAVGLGGRFDPAAATLPSGFAVDGVPCDGVRVEVRPLDPGAQVPPVHTTEDRAAPGPSSAPVGGPSPAASPATSPEVSPPPSPSTSPSPSTLAPSPSTAPSLPSASPSSPSASPSPPTPQPTVPEASESAPMSSAPPSPVAEPMVTASGYRSPAGSKAATRTVQATA